MSLSVRSVDYAGLYHAAQLRAERLDEIRAVCHLIFTHKAIYDRVELESGIPWWVVGAIHSLESSCSFDRHLHNGDPLTNRTVHVPHGRPLAMPKSGRFPYEWYESAVDALSLHTHPKVMDPLPECLQYMEAYNGFGYRKHHVNTPYVWGATTAYSSGLFIRDGSFNPTISSAGIGGAAILKIFNLDQIVAIPKANLLPGNEP